jgi:6-phosphofructokinase
VNVVFTIGGDGTAKGSEAIALELMRRQLRAVVAHVPKTIDNDIPLIDYSFGFGTAVQEATRAVHTARDEAVAYPDGVGLVNLMGRHSGFIAAHASIAARGVDACLVPEVPFTVRAPCHDPRASRPATARVGCMANPTHDAGTSALTRSLSLALSCSLSLSRSL